LIDCNVGVIFVLLRSAPRNLRKLVGSVGQPQEVVLQNHRCPIWNKAPPPQDSKLNSDGEMVYTVDSVRAGGKYCITASAKQAINLALGELDEVSRNKFRQKLTYWLWEENRKNVSYTESEGSSVIVIDKNIVERAIEANNIKYQKRIENILLLLKKEVEKLGYLIFCMDLRAIEEFYDDSHMTFSGERKNAIEFFNCTQTSNRNEAYLLLAYCQSKKFIDGFDENAKLENSPSKWAFCDISLTVEGHMLAETVDRERNKSENAFIAMLFQKEYYENLYPAISKAIYRTKHEPIVINKQNFYGSIHDEILNSISKSKFVVADFTHSPDEGVRGGVYYEAGFARGLGIPVICTCDKKLEKNIHFDVANLNFIFWENEKDLEDRLVERIIGCFGARL